jgi:hypothetical protein
MAGDTQEEPTYGPYELRPGVNSLTFGSDPVVTLKKGKQFSTKEPGIAAFLDEHEDVRRKKKAPASSSGKSKPAAAESGGSA